MIGEKVVRERKGVAVKGVLFALYDQLKTEDIPNKIKLWLLGI